MPALDPPPAADRPPPLAAPSDAELATRARCGDELAFELILRRHNRRLFRLARSLVGRDHEAEDVLQEAYLRAYTRLGDLACADALGGWLARIVANEALGRRRAAARVVSLEDYRARAATDQEDDAERGPAADQPDPERLAVSGELRRRLEAAVEALPPEFRTVFVLREVEGLSTAETAAYLAIRPETVKTRLHRARRQLREMLGEQMLAVAAPSLFDFQGARCDRIVGRVLARLRQPSPPDRPSFTAVAEPARASPRWLGRLLNFVWQRSKR